VTGFNDCKQNRLLRFSVFRDVRNGRYRTDYAILAPKQREMGVRDMDVIEAILARGSVRDFSSTPECGHPPILLFQSRGDRYSFNKAEA
jgi:hypothetical protein